MVDGRDDTLGRVGYACRETTRVVGVGELQGSPSVHLGVLLGVLSDASVGVEMAVLDGGSIRHGLNQPADAVGDCAGWPLAVSVRDCRRGVGVLLCQDAIQRIVTGATAVTGSGVALRAGHGPEARGNTARVGFGGQVAIVVVA